MWGTFNLFGRKKESKTDEKSAEVPGALEQQASQAKISEPIYAPSPWDEHQITDGTTPEAGVVARAGKPLQPGMVVASQGAVAEALKTVYDPEIPVDIYELGLIYEINIEINGDIRLWKRSWHSIRPFNQTYPATV